MLVKEFSGWWRELIEELKGEEFVVVIELERRILAEMERGGGGTRL